LLQENVSKPPNANQDKKRDLVTLEASDVKVENAEELVTARTGGRVPNGNLKLVEVFLV